MLVIAYICLYLGAVVILTALIARFFAGTARPDENDELAEFFAEKKAYEEQRYGADLRRWQ
jgi:hypothetical protein